MLVAASCATSTVEVQDTRPGLRGGIAADESLTIVSVSSSISEDVLKCVEDSLRGEAPALIVVPSRKFRDSMFPWFEPSTMPGSDDHLAQLMGKPSVRQRVMDLGLRYVVALSGGTYTAGNDSWGGCAGGYAAAACVGGMTIDMKTDLTAAILDLTSSQSVGEIEATGAGTSGAGLILLLPYFFISSTETYTCRALAHSIARFVSGSQPPATPSED